MADIPVNASDALVNVDVVTNGQIVFNYDFRADDIADLRAIYKGTGEPQPVFIGGVDFTATGIATANGGTITLTTFTDTFAGAVLTIYRNSIIARTTDYSRDLFATTLNADMDRIYMILQELRRALDETLRASPGESPPDVGTVLAQLAAAIEQVEASVEAATAAAEGAAAAVALADASADTAVGAASSAATSADNAQGASNAAGGHATAAALSAIDAAQSAIDAANSVANIPVIGPGDDGKVIAADVALGLYKLVPQSGGGGGGASLPAFAGADKLLLTNAANNAAVWGDGGDLKFTAWTNGEKRRLYDRARDVACILDFAGADPTGANDSTLALKRMLATGVACEITKGDFVWDASIDGIGMVMNTHGQKLFGHGAGQTAGHYNYWGRYYRPHSRIIFTGTGTPIVRTRREHRINSGSAQDAAMSAAITRAADGTQINDLCIWLDCDYTNLSSSNLGADWDIGIHNMCRIGSREMNTNVLGYFRRYGRLQENTSLDASLPITGYTIPDRFMRGTDDSTYINAYQRGAQIGFAILGAKKRVTAGGDLNPTFDPNYYDSVAGAVVSDTRGSYGASDTTFIACKFFGPDHHSGVRRTTIRGDENHLLEPETAAACVYIDGWGNNAEAAADEVVQGITFKGRNRFETYEAFHIRLDRCNRVQIEGHVDYSGMGGVNYGSVTGTVRTRNVVFGDGWMSNPRDQFFGNFVRKWWNMSPDSGNAQGINLYLKELRTREDASGNGEMYIRKGATGSVSICKSDGTPEWMFYNSGTFGIAPGGGSNLRLGAPSGYIPLSYIATGIFEKTEIGGKTVIAATDTVTGVVQTPNGQIGAYTDSPGATAVLSRSGNGPLLSWGRNGALITSVSVSGTTISYSTSSDMRMKEDLNAIDTSILDKIDVYDFKWKGEDRRGQGVMAQHAEGLTPDLVTKEPKKDQDGNAVMDEHGNPDFVWGVDYSKFVPLLLAAVKDLRARVAELERKMSHG